MLFTKKFLGTLGHLVQRPSDVYGFFRSGSQKLVERPRNQIMIIFTKNSLRILGHLVKQRSDVYGSFRSGSQNLGQGP